MNLFPSRRSAMTQARSAAGPAPARRGVRAALVLAAITALAGVAAAQPVVHTRPAPARLTAFEGPGFALGTVGVEQIDWVGPWAATPDSNWGRLTLHHRGVGGVMFINVRIGDDWVIRNMGVESPLGVGAPQTVSTFFPIAPEHGVAVEIVQMDLVATTVPIETFDPMFIPPTARIDSFFDVFFAVQSTQVALGAEHGAVGMPCPVLFLPPIWIPGMPLSGAQLPDQDKVDNKPQGPNQCAPGAVSNSLRYLHARGLGNLGDAPISTEGLGEVLGTDADGSPQDWPERKQSFFNANPQYRICTKILEGAGASVIDEVVQAIRDGKDVELDLAGHVVFVVGIRVYPDRVELDIYDDNQTDNEKDPKRTVVLKSDGAGGWTCDGFKVDGFVIEAPCPCAADWDHDGMVTPNDFNFFMFLYQLGLPQADFNGDGQVNTLDLQGFLQAFNTPCSN
jgi:hypothetical protein